jgi:hybrid cluster-associated redox disulfide protein
MPATAIRSDMPVEDVMRRFPAIIAVFLRHRMHCIGCAVSPFHTVADAAGEYGMDHAALVQELRAASAAAGVDRRQPG